MKESDSPIVKSRTNFGKILLESVNESISIALGRPITPKLNQTLQAYLGLSIDEMEDHVEFLFSSLTDSFGLQGGDVRKMVVRRMYQKAGVPFYDVAGTHMIQYVHELKRTLS
jgi:coproporphyrinogen III oxidase